MDASFPFLSRRVTVQAPGPAAAVVPTMKSAV